MKSVSLALCCLVITSACSKVKELDERTNRMEKSTSEMSVTTKNMSGTTQKMSVTTEEMKQTTENMYTQIRPKESEDTRTKRFHELVDPKVEMGGKFAAASVYFKKLFTRIA